MTPKTIGLLGTVGIKYVRRSVNSIQRLSDWIVLASLAIVFAACTNFGPKAEAVATPTSTPVFDVEDTGRLPLPTVPVPAQNVPAEVYDVACIGAERTFPANLEPFAPPLNEIETLAIWTTHLSASTIVDSNSLVKAFDLYADGTGVWIDSDLRPVLHGHSFAWSVDLADDDRWSDVDLTLKFDDSDYELTLPLRRKNGQIVEPYQAEGLVVTETRECGEYQAVAEPSEPLPERMWRPSPGPGSPPPLPTISTTIKPSSMLYADGHVYAANGSPDIDFFWEKLTLDGESVAQFRAARSNVEDALFDGEFLWFSDRGEGELRKFDLDGNRLDTYGVSNAGQLAFDGEFLWVAQQQGKSLLKLTRDGERVVTVELPSPPSGIEVAGERLWVALPDDWSVGIYSLDGEPIATTYVQGRSVAMEFDGDNMWVAIQRNFQVRKISPAGETLLTVDMPFAVGPTDLKFDGESMWIVKTCCGPPRNPNINDTHIHRVDLNGNRTGVFHTAYPARDAVFDGESMWFSHQFESSFTRLAVDAEGRFWTPMIGPYTEEELVIHNGTTTIVGTLTIPDGPGPHPAVIVAGGPSTTGRDLFRWGRTMDRVAADDLARNGLAVFRYDSRGLGASSGRLFDYTYEELADDLHTIVDTIMAHPNVDQSQVGLFAGGEATHFVAPILNERNDIAFAGMWNYGLDKPHVSQFALQILNLRFITESEEEIRLLAEHYGRAIETARRGSGWHEFEELVRATENDDHFATNPITQQPYLSLRRMESRWWPSVIDLDMTPLLEGITDVPILLVYGGLNLVIHPDVHVDKAWSAIERSGNTDAQIVIFSKMNDLGHPAKTGQFSEIMYLPQVFYPSFIRPGPTEYITSWALDRVTFQGS